MTVGNKSITTKYVIAFIGAVALALLLAFLFLTTANKNSDALTTSIGFIEGPHLFIKKDKIVASTIRVKGNGAQRNDEPIWKTDIGNKSYDVVISEAGDKFSVSPDLKCLVPPSRYPANEKVMVVSDIEGDFHYFKNMLLGNGVIDEDYNWIFGTGSLVILGDIFDRGDLVTECLWLIYRLDQQAPSSGGRVHLIIGNHEVMVLSGDHRYVHNKYKRILNAVDMTYKELFAPQTVLGGWLRSKNAVEIIGDVLYAHAGISPQLIEAGITVDEINEMVRLEADQGYVHPTDMPDDREIIMGALGPLWFRGFVDDSMNDEVITNITDYFGVEHIVIGHTLVNDMTTLYGNKVVAIDIDKSDHTKEAALYIENGIFYKITKEGNKSTL